MLDIVRNIHRRVDLQSFPEVGYFSFIMKQRVFLKFNHARSYTNGFYFPIPLEHVLDHITR